MLNKAVRHIFISLFLGAGCAQFAIAQNNTHSPYSRFGIGDIAFNGFAQNSAMGRIGQGIGRSNSINVLNPASYSNLQFTIFECAGILERGNIADKSQKQSFNNGSFAYMALGFPVWAKYGWGASFGVQPVSHTGYDIINYIVTSNGVKAQTHYKGEGGMSRIYMGHGIRLAKKLSAGFNMSYIHGQTTTDKTAIFNDPAGVINNYKEGRTRYVSDLSYDLGLQYSDTLNKKDTKRKKQFIGFGLSYTPARNLHSRQKLFARTLYPGSYGDFPADVLDTVQYEDNAPGILKMPASWSAGISWQKANYCMLGLDVKGQNWSKYSNFGQGDSLANSISVNFGAMIIPDAGAIKAKWKRVEYRAGVRYCTTPLLIRGEHLKEYGVSMGLGIPVMKQRSRMNITAEYYQRGTTGNNLIKENYLRLTLGLTFGDKWFYRYKIN